MDFFTSSALGANEGVVEGEDYVILTDKNGTQTRVLNLKNPKNCRRSGIIELEPVKRSSRHENYLSFTRIYDKENNIVIGIPNGIDPKTGELRFKRIILREDEIFDLSNEQQALVWAVVSRHREVDVDGSKTRMGMKPRYKVYDKEKEAEEYLAVRNIKRKAEAIAEGLSGQALVDFAANIGLPSNTMSATQCAMQVIQYAEKQPKKFMDAWENPTRHELTVLKKGLTYGILTQNPLQGICYNALPLGTTEQQAVQYLKNNLGTCNVIEQLIATRETPKVGVIKSPVVEIKDEKDAEIARMKAELEFERKRNADLAKTKMDELVNETTKNIIAADAEWKALVQEAKDLGIKAPHLIKNKETLRKKIEEATMLKNN